MSNVTFNVVSSTPNKQGGHVWKLETETEIECFGIKKIVKRKFYIGGMPVAGTVNTKIVENVNKFTIKEYDCAQLLDDKGEVLGVTSVEDAVAKGARHNVISLSWLHAKPF